MEARKKIDFGRCILWIKEKLTIWKGLLFSCILLNISRFAKLLRYKLWSLVKCIYYTEKYVPVFRPSYCCVSSR